MVFRLLYNAITLILYIGTPIAASFGIDQICRRDVEDWYKLLRKPSWQPPEWVYGTVWPLLYTIMGTSVWMVTQHGGFWNQKWPLFLYTLQLALNLAWPLLFFGKHRLDLALADSIALTLAVSATMRVFNSVEPLTAVMLLPYLLWTAFATVLNYEIWARNPQAFSVEDLKRAKLEAIREHKVGASGAVPRDAGLMSHDVHLREE